MNRKTVAVLPGDGIGPEVLDAALPVIDALGLPLTLETGDIGWRFWQQEGTPVPERTWELIARSDAVLLGATTTKPPREALAELPPQLRESAPKYLSPIIQLRQRLDLFANLRPVSSFLGGAPYRFCVVRENTEGLYSGLDYRHVPDELWTLAAGHRNAALSGRDGTTASIRLQTRTGVDRLLTYAFEHARAHDHRRVTLADKPNVFRDSSAYVRERLEEIAAGYPEIAWDILNVDAVALWMTRRPERFGVIVAENSFGDVLSDLGAGVMGGLGLAPSANIGERGGYFEPVHGSAPALAGTSRANPLAAFLTVGMMLDHLGMDAAGEQIRDAVRRVTRRRDRLTYDLGGVASTAECATAVLEAVGGADHRPTAAVVTVGDELLRADLEDSNASNASRMLGERGVPVRARFTVGDDEATIADAVRGCLGRDDVVVVIGGLGPTSDDVTRSGVARALGVPLVHSERAWDAVVARLTRFGLAVHKDNRRQADFPQDAELLPNANGTAWGCLAAAGDTRVVMLPGPPRECLPMLEAVLAGQIEHLPRPGATATVFRRTLGVIEADVAALADTVAREAGLRDRPAYRWHYPYVDVRLTCPPQDAKRLAARLDEALAGSVVTDRDRTAAQELAAVLDARGLAVRLEDRASGGELAAALAAARAAGPAAGAQRVTIVLDAVREGGADGTPDGTPDTPDGATPVFTGSLRMTCTVTDAAGSGTATLSIPHRGPEVTRYAAEFAAWTALTHLTRETP